MAGVSQYQFGVDASDPDDNPLTYSWVFGDGQTGSGASVTHVYSSAGIFSVNVTISDGSASASPTAVSIKVLPGMAAPIWTRFEIVLGGRAVSGTDQLPTDFTFVQSGLTLSGSAQYFSVGANGPVPCPQRRTVTGSVAATTHPTDIEFTVAPASCGTSASFGMKFVGRTDDTGNVINGETDFASFVPICTTSPICARKGVIKIFR